MEGKVSVKNSSLIVYYLVISLGHHDGGPLVLDQEGEVEDIAHSEFPSLGVHNLGTIFI